jgi:hypothetical protein
MSSEYEGEYHDFEYTGEERRAQVRYVEQTQESVQAQMEEDGMHTMAEAIRISGASTPNRRVRRAIAAMSRDARVEEEPEVLELEPEVPGEARLVCTDGIERKVWRVGKKRNL